MTTLAAFALFAFTLPTGWRLAPAGVSLPLDTFPAHAAALPAGQRALVLHSGFRPPSLAILNPQSRRLENALPLPEAGQNFAFDPASNLAYVPLGHHSSLALVRVPPTFQLALEKTIPLPSVAANSVALSPTTIAVTATLQDAVLLLDRQSHQLLRRVSIPRPTRALFHCGYLYVLSHAEPAQLHVISPNASRTIALSPGPADLAIHGETLFVAAANSNSLDILSLQDPASPQPLERLNLAPSPNWPVGLAPSALSVDPAANRLYIACSGANAIAVADLATRRLAGFLPTAWYPTFALPLPNQSLLVLNGKGDRSFPNPQGPNPAVHRSMTPQPPSPIQYIPLVQTGSARLIEKITPAQLRRHTRTYASLTPSLPRPIPRSALPPIEHVVYIMKENRTYDQVLGDLPQGNGDPGLCLFPERITPNHHALAREFVLFDNFYVNADVSSEGWHWSSAAMVPHAIMQRWPAAYAGRTRQTAAVQLPDPLSSAPGGFLWTAARDAKLSFRNYGFFVENRPNAKPGEPIVASTLDPALLPHTNAYYAGYDPDFPDVDRAKIFLRDLAEFERTGQMPRLITMVLPNDHTWGTAPGKLTPYASMADNDLALGQIVEALSKSRFWPKLAIFVLEDDAQNGPDHVDSHRSPAFILSPYTRRGAKDSAFYNTTSMLHTIEILLGIRSLTQFDATAPPMLPAFAAQADPRPYAARPANVPLDEKNPARATAAQFDFSTPDRLDDREFNNLLWRALRGTDAPAPTRAAFLAASPAP